jgi:transcriptional regulator with XRE-family HTH domain
MSLKIQTGRDETIAVEELLGESEKYQEAYQRRQDILASATLIREMRRRAGLSQDELAKRLGLRQSRISELERGNGEQGPTITTLARVARACDVRLAIAVGPRAFSSDVVLNGEEEDALVPNAGQALAAAARIT